MPESVDPRHLLLIGAGPGVGASVVRRFGREGFRSTLISRGETLEQLAAELRRDGLEIEAVAVDIADLDGYRATLERIFRAPGAPGVAVYNAALPDPGEILDTTVGRLRTAYDVDVLGAVVAAQVAAPVLRSAGTGTLLFTSGGFADHPLPALASLRSIPTTSQSSFGPPTPTRPTLGRPNIDSPARNAHHHLRSTAAWVLPDRSSASSSVMSRAESSKSKICAFSAMRSRWVDPLERAGRRTGNQIEPGVNSAPAA